MSKAAPARGLRKATTRPKAKPSRQTTPRKPGAAKPSSKAPQPPPPAHPQKRKAGRPSKLNDDVQKVIVDALVRGNFQNVAAELAGVDNATICRWMEKGQREEPEFARYREFREAILVANAEAQDAQITRINRAARDGTWQAAAWLLERRFPDQWGRKDKVQHEGADAFASFLDEVARKRSEQVAAAATAGTGDAA